MTRSPSRTLGRHGRVRLLTLWLGAALLTVTLGGLVLPSTAHAESVVVAQARVDRLQTLVKQTTTQLTEGTRRWEADRASLDEIRMQLGDSNRRIHEAEKSVRAGEARVSAMARRLYMSSAPTQLQVAFTQGPDQVIGALEGVNSLSQIAGSDNQLVLRAQAAQHRLTYQQATGGQLEREGQVLVASSAKRLKELNALAQNTANQLVTAQNALQKARADKAAGGSCSAKSTAGQQNGNLDPASLCPLWMAPGERLRADAANTFNRMSKYHAATVGSPLCVTDSYRSYSAQVALYRSKPGLAAVPGNSEHGWGKAVDFCGGIENSGSAASNWMQANAGKFGWFHPDWAQPSGSKPEPWHWEFKG